MRQVLAGILCSLIAGVTLGWVTYGADLPWLATALPAPSAGAPPLPTWD